MGISTKLRLYISKTLFLITLVVFSANTFIASNSAIWSNTSQIKKATNKADQNDDDKKDESEKDDNERDSEDDSNDDDINERLEGSNHLKHEKNLGLFYNPHTYYTFYKLNILLIQNPSKILHQSISNKNLFLKIRSIRI